MAVASLAVSAPMLLDNRGTGDEFDIQWMPPGRQRVGCFVTRPGKERGPEVLSFTVQATHAEAFNAQL